MTVEITSNGAGATAAITVNEAQTFVTNVQATRPALSYAITGGADAAKFTINSSTGALTFVTAPDFEIPTDTGADNTYEVEVTVTDSVNESTDVQTLTVTILDVTEGGGGGTGTTYYVATNGSDSNNGTSTSTPWLTLNKAKNTAVAGDTVYIKAGNYGNQTLSTVRAGTSGQPIRFIGYTSTPGDSPAYTLWNHNSSPNTALMPCIDAGTRENSGYGILLTHAFVHVSGFTVSNYLYGVQVSQPDCSATRIYTREHGRFAVSYSGFGFKLSDGADRFVGSKISVVNANAQAITIDADNCTMDQCSAYCNNSTSNGDPSSGPTDYYFTISGSYNTITNTTLERVGALAHGGHGLQLKSQPTIANDTVTGCVFDGFNITNIDGGIGSRHGGVTGNVFRNGTVTSGQGILVRDGAHDEIFEDITLNNCGRAIWLIETTEAESSNPNNYSAANCIFRRITINNAGYAIDYGSYTDPTATATGNQYDQITINGASYLFEIGHYATNTNILKNSTLNNIPNKIATTGGRSAGDNQTTFSNNTLNNCGFTLP